MAGRGKAYGDRNIPIRRPGESVAASPQALVKKLYSVQFDDSEEKSLSKCADMYETLASSKDDASNAVKLIHSTCLLDSSFCRKVAKFLATLDRRPGSHSQAFRAELLTCLQEDFQGKEKLAKTNPEQFLNTVLLHGEIYDSLRILDAPAQVLAAPLLDYLSLVLKSETEGAAQLILLQMTVNGVDLKDQAAPNLDKFLVEIRQTLVESQLSSKVKLRLLLALEIGSGSFTFADGPSRNYYSEELGKDFQVLESRLFGIPLQPDHSPTAVITTKGSSDVASFSDKMASINLTNTGQMNSVGMIPDVEAVRGRMRAKGLLPRRGTDSRIEKDNDVYGIQIHKHDSKSLRKDALTAPLPVEDWE